MEKPRAPDSNDSLNSERHVADDVKQSRPSRRWARGRIIFWLIILVLIALLILYVMRQQHAHKQSAVKPIPVQTALAKTKDVPVYLPALGQVTPTYNVTVRTQVNGRLLRVDFTEGQLVKAGQLIAQIDPRPFLAQLEQFQGQLERDQAQLHNARLDLARYQTLAPIGAVSKQVYTSQIWLVKQLEGTVKADQGQVDAVKVNLIYTNITSPINGRIGLRLVDPGNFVQTTDTTGLAVINTIQPITVVFSLPEDNVPQVLQQINAGKQLQVEAYDRQQNKLLAVGTLLTIDNQIDTTTGTVKLKANFANQNYALFPNQFVNVQLLVTKLQHVVVVPTAAVQHGPQGTFVFLVNANDTVSIKPVIAGITVGDDTVINSGVTLGNTVVIDGIDKLTEGSPVAPLLSKLTLPLPSYGYNYPHGVQP